MPASQADVVAVVTVLAREARWDPRDAAVRARGLWVQARMSVSVGRPVAEFMDPLELEVHPAIDAGAAAAGLPRLPAYVTRDHDERLRDVIQRAVAGRSAIAVLVGGSSTGKTRACWEAVQTLPTDWRLWHPINPGPAEAAAEAFGAIGPRTVVWRHADRGQHPRIVPRPGTQWSEGLTGASHACGVPDRTG